MVKQQDIQEILEYSVDRTVETDIKLKFDKSNAFQIELRRRVDELFQNTKRRKRDCPQMYLKTAILLFSYAMLYILLVFWSQSVWMALPLSILLGLVGAGIGFNVQHDGGHQAYSNFSWVNKLMAMTSELIGGSCYNWHWKHSVFHHTYSNIEGHDSDLDLGVLGRLTPYQQQLSFHQWQHYYLWLLYGLMAIRWHLYDDFQKIITLRIGNHPYPRPTGWDMVIFVGGKAIFFTLAFGIPLLLHPVWVVIIFYGVAAIALGISLSLVFQLAHIVEEAEFPLPQEDSGRIDNPWAIHQVETTVNFCRYNPVMSWFLGGLNFQIEHHLFPRICHVNYLAMSKVVEETCKEFGVKYVVHESFWAGLVSHGQWLRRMGMVNVAKRS
jgi:linoleoyl-CoA desaturase